MRRFSFDPYEFESPCTEEFLEIAISSTRQHQTLSLFLKECGAASPPVIPIPENSIPWRWEDLAAIIQQRTGVNLPLQTEWEAIVLSNNWEDLAFVLRAGATLVWYHWSTTA